MTRTPPTLDELRQLGLTWIESARQQLIETRSLMPIIFLGDAVDGAAPMMISIPSKAMNSHEAKEGLVAMVKKEIDEHGYMHAISVTDAWGMEIGQKDAFKARLLHEVLGLSLSEIAKSGLGKLRESVWIFIQTVTTTLTLELKYHRAADGAVESFEPVRELNNVDFTGKFKFF